MMRKLRGKPRIGLTLGSGGAKGLSHIAFIKVLDEKDIKPAVISGTSIGALIGAFYAGGMSGLQMEDLFDDMGIRRMGSMMDPSIFSNSGLLKGKKVEAFLADNLPCRDFSDLPIPLKVVATDFWNREEVVFSSGDLVTAVCASISVPVVMEPKLVEDRVLTDGGAVNPLPYDLIREDCEILIAIDVTGERSPDEDDPFPTMIENVFSTFQIMQAAIIHEKMRKSRPDIIIQPQLHGFQMMDFYRKDDIFRSVEKDVERFREELTVLVDRKSRR